MSMTDELRELEQLHASGELTDAEYERAKTKVIGGGSPLDSISPTRIAGWMSERQWAMILHLSHLLGYSVVPILGLATPIIIWQLLKDDYPSLDEHGRNATNWIISELIYVLISALLIVVMVGIPMLVVLGIVGVIFPILAGLKANDGVVWQYPLTMKFV